MVGRVTVSPGVGRGVGGGSYSVRWGMGGAPPAVRWSVGWQGAPLQDCVPGVG